MRKSSCVPKKISTQFFLSLLLFPLLVHAQNLRTSDAEFYTGILDYVLSKDMSIEAIKFECEQVLLTDSETRDRVAKILGDTDCATYIDTQFTVDTLLRAQSLLTSDPNKLANSLQTRLTNGGDTLLSTETGRTLSIAN